MFDVCLFVFISSGGVIVTVSGNNLDSVAAPVMAITVELNNEVVVFHQVSIVSPLQNNNIGQFHSLEKTHFVMVDAISWVVICIEAMVHL